MIVVWSLLLPCGNRKIIVSSRQPLRHRALLLSTAAARPTLDPERFPPEEQRVCWALQERASQRATSPYPEAQAPEHPGAAQKCCPHKLKSRQHGITTVPAPEGDAVEIDELCPGLAEVCGSGLPCLAWCDEWSGS